MTKTRKGVGHRFLEKASAIVPRDSSAAASSDNGAAWGPNSLGSPDAPADDISSQPDPAGSIIGSYRVIRSLGRGGMGEVFLAERADDQFRQNVAIKLVRRGLLSGQVQSRLRQERQILASLDHPNIARLYDGGTTPDGTPYIVMEYIDGEPIDIHCDQRQLTIEQRLRLFITVCSAVHRAHQNLVVHRDLKPSNILVTRDGVPKLLDFGIAKRLDMDVQAAMYTMAVTQADIRVMTPDHASPEQIRGDLISTASDIYVLGVLLYELLTGYKPFCLRGKHFGEVERTICEEVPAMPSEVIATAERQEDSGIAAVAAQRSTGIAKLRRELKGDLDNIVAMAMRKEPERRYSSAEQLAGDVERYLRGMPVLARPDSWNYRAGKFVRRYALGVTLSAALIATLIGFTVTVYMQSLRIEQERDVAQAQRTIADSQRERAETVSRFLIDSFKVVDPIADGSKVITAREILDNGAARISHELNDQQEIKADVLDTIGSAYLGLGLPDQARPLIEQGLAVRRQLFGDNSAAVASSLNTLNQVYEKEDKLDLAEQLASQALAINQRQTGPASTATATSFCRLGIIKKMRGEFAAAEKLLQSCLDIQRARLGPHDALNTIPLDNLAHIASQRGESQLAKAYLAEALQIDRKARSEEHPLYIRHLIRLAEVTHDLGETSEAEALYRKVVALNQRVLGPEHPDSIDTLSAFGIFLLETDRLDEAQKVLTAVLDANRRARGSTHSYIGNDLENLARVAYRRGDFAGAERYLEDALKIYRERLPPTHGFIATSLTTLGRTQLALHRPKEAQQSLVEAVRIWQVEYGQDSSGYHIASAALAWAKASQGKYAEAEPALLKAYPKLSTSTRKSDLEMAADVRRWIEQLYAQMGRPAAATEYFSSLQQQR